MRSVGDNTAGYTELQAIQQGVPFIQYNTNISHIFWTTLLLVEYSVQHVYKLELCKERNNKLKLSCVKLKLS